MDKEYAQKKAAAYRKRAETAYENYQQSGEQRYYRAHIEAELIADAIDHYVSEDDLRGNLAALRGIVCRHAANAESLLNGKDVSVEAKEELKGIVSTAVLLCGYSRKY